MSAYYHGELRDVFVGGLFLVAALLIAYRGYSDRENIALNLAGIFAIVVALVPTAPPSDDEYVRGSILDFLTLHGTAAVLFFACCIYVAWTCHADTLEHRDEKTRKRFIGTYKTIASGFLLVPLAAFVANYLTGGSAITFWIEAFAVVVFAFYWWVKSRELRSADLSLVGESGS